MKIIHKPTFSKQLKHILEYIARDKPSASMNFKNKLKENINLIPNNPYKYEQSKYFDNKNIRNMTFKKYRQRGSINMLIIFSVGVFFASLTMRIDSIMDRTGMMGSSKSWNIFLTIITLASGISMFALMTYGFIEYKWWIPVLVFIGFGLISAIIVNGRTFMFFTMARPLFALFSIISAIWCWII